MSKNKLAVRVMDNDEVMEYGSDTMLIEITPSIKEKMLQRRDQLARMRKEDSDIYEITSWDFVPTFLKTSMFGEHTDYKHDDSINGEKEYAILGAKEFKSASEIETVRANVVLMHVKEEGIRWTGNIKNTDIEFYTGTIPFSLIESL